jgi:hypothetical protein
MRNWKERWDANAEFVFNKTMNLGLDPANPRVVPGDPVDKEALGLGRLKHWWNAGFIRLDIEADNAPKARIVRITTNCFEVRVPGKQIIRVNTKEEADSTLRMLTGQKSPAKKEGGLPYMTKLNQAMWALHTVKGTESIRGFNAAVARLHEAASGR